MARRACSRAATHPSTSLLSAHSRARARQAAATCSCDPAKSAVTRACAAAHTAFTRSNAVSWSTRSASEVAEGERSSRVSSATRSSNMCTTLPFGSDTDRRLSTGS